jgi:hypothetical protein
MKKSIAALALGVAFSFGSYDANGMNPGSYLMVNDWKKCVKSHHNNPLIKPCLPEEKPQKCSDKAWKSLNNLNERELKRCKKPKTKEESLKMRDDRSPALKEIKKGLDRAKNKENASDEDSE